MKTVLKSEGTTSATQDQSSASITLKVNDCRARQARRRALKVQLPALFRAHGFYRPEIVRHVLTYVGFDLPGGRLTG